MRLLILLALPAVAFFSATLSLPSSRLEGLSAFAQAESSRGSPQQLLYDADRRQLVLLTAPRDPGRMMAWNLANSGWTLDTASGPPARELGGAAYDSRRRRIALFGGIAPNNGETRRDDTWEWDGHDWREMTDRSAGPRSHHAMVFDEARGVIVMFGGGNSSRSLANDTWEWDGSTWHRVATDGPPGRAHFAMVYDALRKRTVVSGGFDERYRYLNDVWAWDGKSWERVADGGPPTRSHHSMAFDPRSGSIIMFGGLRNGRVTDPLGDTWILTGQQWRSVETSGPSARSGHVMAYDPVRQRVVLYGGSSFDGKASTHFRDTWAWDGSRWSRIN